MAILRKKIDFLMLEDPAQYTNAKPLLTGTAAAPRAGAALSLRLTG